MKTTIKKLLLCIILLYLFSPITTKAESKSIAIETNDNITYYETLSEAISNIKNNEKTTIKILNSIKLNSIVTIPSNKNIIIDGNNNLITREQTSETTWYNGQLFNIKSNAELTLKNIVIDNENNWTFDTKQYQEDIKNKIKVSETTQKLQNI